MLMQWIMMWILYFHLFQQNLQLKLKKDFARDYVVASNASAHRMKKNIPLVIPEVNPEYLDMIDAQQRKITGTDSL